MLKAQKKKGILCRDDSFPVEDLSPEMRPAEAASCGRGPQLGHVRNIPEIVEIHIMVQQARRGAEELCFSKFHKICYLTG